MDIEVDVVERGDAAEADGHGPKPNHGSLRRGRVDRRCGREHRAGTGDEGDADGGALVGTERGDVLASAVDPPRRHRHEAGLGPNQRRLPGAVAADQGDELAAGRLEVRVVKDASARSASSSPTSTPSSTICRSPLTTLLLRWPKPTPAPGSTSRSQTDSPPTSRSPLTHRSRSEGRRAAADRRSDCPAITTPLNQ